LWNSSDYHQPLLNGRLHSPEIGRLADEERVVGQAEKEVDVVRAKVDKNILVGAEL